MNPRPHKFPSKKVAARSFIVQGGREPLAFISVWAASILLLIAMWRDQNPTLRQWRFSLGWTTQPASLIAKEGTQAVSLPAVPRHFL